MQPYDSAGVPIDTELAVASLTAGGQQQSAIASETSGDFVVVWASVPGGYSDVIGRRFDASAVPKNGEFVVNTYTTGNQLGPAVASAADGRFIVVWESFPGQDGDGYGVFAQLYDGTGSMVGAEFRVNSYTTGDQKKPTVAMDGAGTFLVAWTDYGGQDGDATGIRGRWYDGGGATIGAEFQVNTYTTGFQDRPDASASPRGDVVVVWSGEAEHASVGAVGRRLRSWLFVDNFESGDPSAWSAAVP